MYFKILPESALFKAIHDLREKGKEADKAAVEWITNTFGEFHPYYRPYNVLCHKKLVYHENDTCK